MPREFKTIIAPTDFSDASFTALEYAVRFARAADGTVVVPHILHNPMSDEFRIEGHRVPFAEVKSKAEEHLAALRQDKLAGYPKCVMQVEVGDPYSEIMNIARQQKADLIVIATHGRTGLQHLIMGSVAEKIIRHAPCPVFVVRHGVE
jgi:nucleotide-binding universal stress UspA family protein